MNTDIKIKTIAFIPLLLLVTILFHSVEFRVAHWNPDEVIFAAGGQKILAGEMLYRDFGDNKPPLIYYTYALIYRLAGTSYVSLLLLSKLFTIAVIFLIALGLYLIGNSLGGRRIGVTSALLFAAYSICSQGSEVLGGRSEIYATLMSVTGLYFFMKKDFALKTFDLLMCSFLQSLATLYNTRFGIVMAACGLFILYKHGIGKRSIKAGIALSVPFILALAAVPLYYYSAGVFDYYTFWQSTVVRHYLAIMPLSLKAASGLMILFFFAGPLPLVFFAVYQVVGETREKLSSGGRTAEPAPEQQPSWIARWSMKAGRVKRLFAWDEERQSFLFLMLLFILLYAAFFTGGKPGIRYFYMMFVPLCLLAAIGFNTLYDLVAINTISKGLARVMRVILVLFMASSPSYFFVIHMNTPRTLLLDSIKENRRLAEYIKENTSDKDRIFSWVSVNPIYLKANRIMATSMIYPAEFLCRYYYYTGDFQNETTAWDIFLRQLKKEKPAIIIDDTGGFITKKDNLVTRVIRNDYVEQKAGEMKAFIKENYRQAESIEGYDIYKRI